MRTTHTGVIAVIGSGLAATVLTAALAEKLSSARKVLWFGGDLHPRAGSNVPVALVHPFPGLKPKLDAFSGQQWRCAENFLNNAVGAQLHRAPIERRVAPRALAFWRALATQIPASRNRQFGSSFELRLIDDPDDPRVRYGPAIAYEPAPLLAALRATVQSSPRVERVSAEVDAIVPGEDGYTLRAGHSTHSAHQVVVAAGAGSGLLLADHGGGKLWRNGGELVYSLTSTPMSRFYIHGGHEMTSARTRAWGSSYNEYAPGDPRPPATEQLAAVRKRLNLLHDLAEDPASQRWAGDRIIHRPSPNAPRRPWIAEVSRDLFAFTGFGSTGSLRIPFAARQLAERLAG